MANRRMFAKTIIDSDAFLDMSLSAQALYFHLSMRADDEGFINNPKKIQRTIGGSDDDLRLLIAKNFIIPFESGVVVIKHWKINNYIQIDRFNKTVYDEERSLLTVKDNGAYTLDTPWIQDGYTLETQVRIGKDSIGKYRLGEDRDIECFSPQLVVELFNELCPSFPSVRALSDARKKAIKARLNFYSLDDFRELFKKAEASPFLKGKNERNWQATFDWLITDKNMAKVLDGNYDAREPQNTAGTKLDETYSMLQEWVQKEE